MLINIPAPWSIWALFIAYYLSCAGHATDRPWIGDGPGLLVGTPKWH